MGNTVVAPSGEMITENRRLASFTKLNLQANVDMNLELAKGNHIVLCGDKNFLPHIKTEVNGSTLEISVTGSYSIPRSTETPPITLGLDLNSIKKIELNSSGRLKMLDGLTEKKPKFRIEMNGMGCELEARVEAAALDAQFQGMNCRLWLSSGGGFDKAKYEINGMGINVDAQAAETKLVKIQVNGVTSQMNVFATEKLSGDINGWATVYVYGGPLVKVQTNGGGKVVQMPTEGAGVAAAAAIPQHAPPEAAGAPNTDAPPTYDQVVKEKLAEEATSK